MYRFLFALSMIFAPAALQAQGGFLLGLAAGSILGGGDDSHLSSGATMLYIAKEEVLKVTDPLSIKMVSSGSLCFTSDSAGTSKSLGEIFNDLMRRRGNHQRTVLQIVRVFSSGSSSCAFIWYAYLEK